LAKETQQLQQLAAQFEAKLSKVSLYCWLFSRSRWNWIRKIQWTP
jgi:hypothetical protein